MDEDHPYQKYYPPPDEQLTPTDKVFDSALSDSSSGFDESLKAKLNDTDDKKLRTIGAFIMNGLPLDEACTLARVSLDKLNAIMDENEDVRSFVIFKQVAYKASLLSVISRSAIKGQPKFAGYLLEKKYPKEYDPQKNDDTVRQPDMIEAAIEFVRDNAGTYKRVLTQTHERT